MITHESWQRIKEIFQSAQELTSEERSDFLDRACGDDKSLREEVEALLTADAGNDDFLSAPAYEFAASILAGEETEFSAGQKVGPYTILCPLGSGGMGQIYLAEDARLRRKIAIKLISSQAASNPLRVQRFKQEALAVSALNHPNICVIYELGTTESGRHFIAMEYIQGATLRQQLSRGHVSVQKALNIAVQIATALSSAHATGIVHRDIKPENIMVRPDGYVKVLDFGLAKLTEILPSQEGAGAGATNVRTETGMLMGTVKYMSPEQLRDARIDERTDIWSLGVVLYEMLTGATPFEAPTSNETVAAVLAPQRSRLKFPDEIPKQLQDIVSKALEKERDHRYQTVVKFATDLTRLRAKLQRQESEFYSYSPQGDEHQTRKIERSGLFTRLKTQALHNTEIILGGIRTHKKAAIFTGITGVLFFLLFLPGAARYVSSWINPPTVPIKMLPLTNAGTTVCAAISPDGKWTAHAEEKAGLQRLVLTNIATAASTDVVAAADVQYIGVTFTPDSNYLYFTRAENTRGILYQLALPGGPPAKIKEEVDSPVSFSPQQDRFAFVRLDKTTLSYLLIISTIDGLSEQVLATRKDGDAFSVYGPAWSPDGGMIVCPVRSWTNGYNVNLIGIDVKNRSEKSLSDHPWFAILQVAWQNDMSGLVMSARDQPTAPVRLWRISYPGGELKQITLDLAEYRGVSLAGQDIVTVRSEWTWELVVASAEKNFAQPSTIASGVGLNYGVTWAGNKRILYSAMVQDSLIISRIDVDGSNQVPITVKAKNNYSPAATSDGRFVVFSSNRTGSYNIWRMNAEDGSDQKQLTFSDSNFYPAVSPDNRWVAYDKQQAKEKSVWKVPLEGGNEIKVADRYRMPVFSPDSQFIVARFDLISGTNDTVILNADTAELWKQIKIPNLEWQRINYTSENTLSYIEKINGYPNIVSYDIVSGEKKPLTNFSRNQIFSYAWSPDSRLLACQLGTKNSNVVTIR